MIASRREDATGWWQSVHPQPGEVQQFLGGNPQTGAHAVDVWLAGVKPAIVRREITQLLEVLEPLHRIAPEIDARVRGDGVDQIVELLEVPVGALDIGGAAQLLIDLD